MDDGINDINVTTAMSIVTELRNTALVVFKDTLNLSRQGDKFVHYSYTNDVVVTFKFVYDDKTICIHADTYYVPHLRDINEVFCNDLLEKMKCPTSVTYIPQHTFSRDVTDFISTTSGDKLLKWWQLLTGDTTVAGRAVAQITSGIFDNQLKISLTKDWYTFVIPIPVMTMAVPTAACPTVIPFMKGIMDIVSCPPQSGRTAIAFNAHVVTCDHVQEVMERLRVQTQLYLKDHIVGCDVIQRDQMIVCSRNDMVSVFGFEVFSTAGNVHVVGNTYLIPGLDILKKIFLADQVVGNLVDNLTAPMTEYIHISRDTAVYLSRSTQDQLRLWWRVITGDTRVVTDVGTYYDDGIDPMTDPGHLNVLFTGADREYVITCLIDSSPPASSPEPSMPTFEERLVRGVMSALVEDIRRGNGSAFELTVCKGIDNYRDTSVWLSDTKKVCSLLNHNSFGVYVALENDHKYLCLHTPSRKLVSFTLSASFTSGDDVIMEGTVEYGSLLYTKQVATLMVTFQKAYTSPERTATLTKPESISSGCISYLLKLSPVFREKLWFVVTGVCATATSFCLVRALEVSVSGPALSFQFTTALTTWIIEYDSKTGIAIAYSKTSPGQPHVHSHVHSLTSTDTPTDGVSGVVSGGVSEVKPNEWCGRILEMTSTSTDTPTEIVNSVSEMIAQRTIYLHNKFPFVKGDFMTSNERRVILGLAGICQDDSIEPGMKIRKMIWWMIAELNSTL